MCLQGLVLAILHTHEAFRELVEHALAQSAWTSQGVVIVLQEIFQPRSDQRSASSRGGLDQVSVCEEAE